MTYNAFEHRQEIEDALTRRGISLITGKFKHVYKTQSGRCPICDQPVLKIHHNWFVAWGGSDRVQNLWYVHERCHISYHEQNNVLNLRAENARMYMVWYKSLRLMRLENEYSEAVWMLMAGVSV